METGKPACRLRLPPGPLHEVVNGFFVVMYVLIVELL
jgi:hypothetical protein